MRKKERGFTLVEVVVVVAMIALISAFSIPKVRGYMAKGKDAKAIVLLSRLRMASEMYYAEKGETVAGSGELGGLSSAHIAKLVTYLDGNAQKSFVGTQENEVEIGGSGTSATGPFTYGGTIGFTFSKPTGSSQETDGVYIWFAPISGKEYCTSGKKWIDY